jgi:hypothetical protein
MRFAAVGMKTCDMGWEFLRLSLFLELRADQKWPFEQFRKALEDPGMEGTKPEARWQMLNASLNAIKRAVRRD